MKNRFSNAERRVENGPDEYLCDVCIKWFKTGESGFEYQFNAGSTNWGSIRKRLCPKCAKRYKAVLRNAFDLLATIKSKYEEQDDETD